MSDTLYVASAGIKPQKKSATKSPVKPKRNHRGKCAAPAPELSPKALIDGAMDVMCATQQGAALQPKNPLDYFGMTGGATNKPTLEPKTAKPLPRKEDNSRLLDMLSSLSESLVSVKKLTLLITNTSPREDAQLLNIREKLTRAIEYENAPTVAKMVGRFRISVKAVLSLIEHLVNRCESLEAQLVELQTAQKAESDKAVQSDNLLSLQPQALRVERGIKVGESVTITGVSSAQHATSAHNIVSRQLNEQDHLEIAKARAFAKLMGLKEMGIFYTTARGPFATDPEKWARENLIGSSPEKLNEYEFSLLEMPDFRRFDTSLYSAFTTRRKTRYTGNIKHSVQAKFDRLVAMPG